MATGDVTTTVSGDGCGCCGCPDATLCGCQISIPFFFRVTRMRFVPAPGSASPAVDWTPPATLPGGGSRSNCFTSTCDVWTTWTIRTDGFITIDGHTFFPEINGNVFGAGDPCGISLSAPIEIFDGDGHTYVWPVGGGSPNIQQNDPGDCDMSHWAGAYEFTTDATANGYWVVDVEFGLGVC